MTGACRRACKTRRFNLSILECKCVRERFKVICAGALIYPYWNVNLYDRRLHESSACALIYPYWNVNLRKDNHKVAWDGALIYPYWNVNNWYARIMSYGKRALIYPYWNVNTHSNHKLRAGNVSFNLSILECK